MRYPKRGETLWVVGELSSRTRYYVAEAKTPAIVVAGGIDSKGRTHVMIPMVGEFWAHAYQIIYPDTNLCADGQPRWDEVIHVNESAS